MAMNSFDDQSFQVLHRRDGVKNGHDWHEGYEQLRKLINYSFGNRSVRSMTFKWWINRATCLWQLASNQRDLVYVARRRFIGLTFSHYFIGLTDFLHSISRWSWFIRSRDRSSTTNLSKLTFIKSMRNNASLVSGNRVIFHRADNLLPGNNFFALIVRFNCLFVLLIRWLLRSESWLHFPLPRLERFPVPLFPQVLALNFNPFEY